MSRSGGIGRRTGFKIQRWQHRKGSSPFSGTREFIDPVWVYFFVFFIYGYFREKSFKMYDTTSAARNGRHTLRRKE